MTDPGFPEDLGANLDGIPAERVLNEPLFQLEPPLQDFVGTNGQAPHPHQTRNALTDPFVFRSDLGSGPEAFPGLREAGLPNPPSLWHRASHLVNLFGRGRGGGGRGGGGRGGGRGNGGRGRGNGGRGDADDAQVYIDPSLTLESIGGLEEHVEYVRRAIIYPLTKAASLKKWGVEPPKGIMFHGPPGTGKTLLAKAVANEVGKLNGVKVSFYFHSGGQSFSILFGESSAKLRDLFETAIRNKPSIIFFDEIDSLCPNREKSVRCSQAYVTVLTTMLGLIDAVKRGDVFIIAATNRLDSLDPAVRRPGRFDHELCFPLPNDIGRERIVQIHTSHWPRDKPEGEMMKNIVKKTGGFTGADLRKLCIEAARAAGNRCEVEKSTPTTVTEDDWAKAYSEMARSAIDVFGSSLHVAQPLHPALLPLFGKAIDAATKAMDACMGQDLPTIKQVLLWDQVNSNDFQLSSVVQGILNKESMKGASVFVLDEVVLRRKIEAETVNTLGAVRQTIEQVINSKTPAILLLPKINILHGDFNRWERSGSSFISELQKIRGHNKFILATWLGPLDDNGDESRRDLLDFFDMSDVVPMKKPKEGDRQAFFAQLDLPNEDLTRAVQLTQEDGAHGIVTLYQQLCDALPSKEKIKEVLGARRQ